jgi:hypothetical protein
MLRRLTPPALVLAAILLYIFVGMATAKGIAPRFKAGDWPPDTPELCGFIWPAYWTYRFLDWSTSWAEPVTAAGPER